jgi:protein SCO1/2
MTRREWLPLGMLAAILAITAAWWALALWPLPADTPAWLERTRFVCFGSTRDTLPTAAGWSLLIGEPLGMLAALLVIWRQDLAAGLIGLARSWGGRGVLAGTALLVVAGLAATGARVAEARSARFFDPLAGEMAAVDVAASLDRPAPALALTDQHGTTFTLDRVRGRRVAVLFAYKHCATVCPLVVYAARDARAQMGDSALALVIVTLDPWRDTPARLPAMARDWRLAQQDVVLSGPVDAVNAALDAWQVPRSRDEATGEITHGAPVYLVDARGRLQYQAPGYAEAIVTLASRMEGTEARRHRGTETP